MTMISTAQIEQLNKQGVTVVSPTVSISPEVNLERIQGPDTTLFPGTTLRGSELLISSGCKIGEEGPAVVDGCALDRNVHLKGGYFCNAVFLQGASIGLGAHVRAGTLLEEQASGAHTVGLKQTVLLPFVTLGSLINFCDILMAGGTSRRDHSEVGSSFIHFNFTPFGANGDKATPSLIGDVPHGVMLRSPRIFLGGQAGLVGPIHIDYGTVLAAGCVYRQDHGPNQMVVGERSQTIVRDDFNPTRFTRIGERVKRNLQYIGNLVALWHWYDAARMPLASNDETLRLVYAAGQKTIESGIKERTKQLGRLASYMDASIRELTRNRDRKTPETETQRAFANAWPQIETRLGEFKQAPPAAAPKRQLVAQYMAQQSVKDYVEAVKTMPANLGKVGTLWLSEFVTWTESQFSLPNWQL